MKKAIKALLAASLCVVALVAMAACSSGAQQSSSSSSSGASEQMQVEDSISTEPFYIAIIGSDSRWGTAEDPSIKKEDPSYSDVNMLVRVDPSTFNIAILSIPRDTETDIDGNLEKMNHTFYSGGPNGLLDAVNNLTGVRPQYYLETSFLTYTQLIDELGGALADVPFDMSVSEPISNTTVYLTEGDNQTLKGTDALGLGRQRKQYANDGDACRQIRNRQVVMNMIRKVASLNPDQADTYAGIMMQFADSNMDEQTLAGYVKLFMENSDKITFNDGTGPYEGGEYPDRGWTIPRDEETYHQLAAAMASGEPLQDIIPLPTIAKGDQS